MSKPVFEDLFTYKGRRNRKSYLIASTLANIVMAIGGLGLWFLMDDGTLSYHVEKNFLYAISGAGLISALCVGAQRLQDMNREPWLAMFTLVPYLGGPISIGISAIRGTDGPNKYGPDPLTLNKPTTQKRKLAPKELRRKLEHGINNINQ